MNNLINIKNENGKQLVSARELHEFLGSGQDFTTWIKSKIEKYDFIENTDFTLHKFMEGKVWKHEYVITLNMAKELSMVENNEKGKEARKYFIYCEKQLMNNMPLLSKELQAIFAIDKRTIEFENRMDNLEDNMPLFNVECKELQALVRKIGIKTLGGYKSPAYKNNSLRGTVYADIQSQLKREFGIHRYEAIKRIQLERATDLVNQYILPLYLQDQITLANNQINFNKELN